jgi:hypothetical protein
MIFLTSMALFLVFTKKIQSEEHFGCSCIFLNLFRKSKM